MEQNTIKFGVVGSREINLDYKGFREELKELLSELSISVDNISLISGGAKKGIDKYAEDFAKEFNFEIEVFKPDFSKGYHVSKFHQRNMKIAKECDFLLAFWDGKSKGTLSTINKAKKLKPEEKVIILTY